MLQKLYALIHKLSLSYYLLDPCILYIQLILDVYHKKSNIWSSSATIQSYRLSFGVFFNILVVLLDKRSTNKEKNIYDKTHNQTIILASRNQGEILNNKIK